MATVSVPTVPIRFESTYDVLKMRRLAEQVTQLGQSVVSVANQAGSGAVPSGGSAGDVLTRLATGGTGWAAIPPVTSVAWDAITGVPSSFPPALHTIATTEGLGPDHNIEAPGPGAVLVATGTSQAVFGYLNLAELGDVDTTGAANGYVLTYDSAEGLWVPQPADGGFSGLTPGTVYVAQSPTTASFIPLTFEYISGNPAEPTQLGYGTPQYGFYPQPSVPNYPSADPYAWNIPTQLDTVLLGDGYWHAISDIDISWAQISNVPAQMPTPIGDTGQLLRADGSWANVLSPAGNYSALTLLPGQIASGDANTPTLVVLAPNDQWGQQIIGNPDVGGSFGLIVQAGTNSTDQGLAIVNWDNSVSYLLVNGDGSGYVNDASWDSSGNWTFDGTLTASNSFTAAGAVVPNASAINMSLGTYEGYFPAVIFNMDTGTADNNLWNEYVDGSGSYYLQAVNDANSASKILLTATRSGLALTGVFLGNSTDYAPITLNGPTTIATGATYSWDFNDDGSLTVDGSEGSSGYVLTSGGSGQPVSWQAGGGGGGDVSSVSLNDDSTTPIYDTTPTSGATGAVAATITLITQDANYVFAGPASGAAAEPTFRALVSADIPNNAANTTGTAGGLSTTLAIASGGTGQTSASAAFAALSPLTTEGDILYENATPTPARLAIGTSGQVLTVSSGLPAWSTLSIPTAANPSGTVGLSTVDGSATTFMRSDAAPPLSQAIVPTWTGAHTFAPSAGGSAAIIITAYEDYQGIAAYGNSTTNKSFGVGIQAGTSSSDWALLVNDYSGTTLLQIYGDGGVEVGTATGGDKGIGTINAEGLYVDGSAVMLAPSSPAQGDILYYNGSAWVTLAPGTSGYVLTTQGASADPEWAAGGAQATPQMRGATFSGGTLAITTPVNAVPIYVPYDCTITNATLLTQGGTGSCQLDIWKIAYASYPPVLADSIVASAPPKITSGDTYTDSTLTGWTTSLSAGDTLLVVLDSTSTFTEISLFLTLTPTGFVNNGYTNADAIAAVVTQLANPTGTVGLSAVDGVADTFMRSDAAPALSQAIAPTWTGAHTFSASSGTSVTINGNDGANALIVDGNATSGGSYGILVNAGTTSADYAMLVRNQATTYSFMGIYGDGHGFLGGETYDAMQWDTTGNILGISVDTLPSGIDNAYGQTVFGVDGLPEFTLMRGGGGNVYMLGNMYYNGSEWVALNTDASESIVMDGGSIAFQSGPSTTAGDSVTLTNIFVINSTTSPTLQGYGPTAATLVDMTPDYGTFTGTFTGYSTSLTGTVGWVRMGKLVMLMFPAVGVSTSNATTFTMTGLPAAIQTTQTVVTSCFPAENDSGGITAYGTLTSGSGTITFSQNGGTASSAWTSSGSKGIAVACMVCYFLGD